MNNVLEYLEEAAVLHPDRIALNDGKRSLTYGQLIRLSKQIGNHETRLALLAVREKLISNIKKNPNAKNIPIGIFLCTHFDI